MTGKKYDQGKPKISLLPSKAILEVAKVATMGADKYGAYNYLGGMDHSRLLDAGERHRWLHISGETFDQESGLYHLAHSAWNDLALLEYMIRGIGKDDRFKDKK